MTEPMRVCPTCPEGENEWPAEHFTYSSGSPGLPVCNACWQERFARVSGPCEVCGLRVNTSRAEAHRGDPLVHRRCRGLADQQAKLERLLGEWERRGKRPNRYLKAI